MMNDDGASQPPLLRALVHEMVIMFEGRRGGAEKASERPSSSVDEIERAALEFQGLLPVELDTDVQVNTNVSAIPGLVSGQRYAHVSVDFDIRDWAALRELLGRSTAELVRKTLGDRKRGLATWDTDGNVRELLTTAVTDEISSVLEDELGYTVGPTVGLWQRPDAMRARMSRVQLLRSVGSQIMCRNSVIFFKKKEQ